MIGAGARGWHTYGKWGLKNKDKIIFLAVAEPRKARREGFAKDWDIPKEFQFDSWEKLLDAKIGKIADACLICTQDKGHKKPAIKALDLGYHVLLEKPMATTESDCKKLVGAAEEAGKQLRICHIARYTTMFTKIKQAIKEGLVGKIININHSENVAYWHFPHGYVRGTWRRSDMSSPVILAKTCHDLDLLYWLVESPAEYIQSFGELSFYKTENAPEGAPERCTDGCPVAEKCPWFAPRLYVSAIPILRITQTSKKRLIRLAGKLLLNHRKLVKVLSYIVPPLKRFLNWQYWPATVITDDLSYEGKMKALKEGPWGRCVFHCDNDVPDHQTVNIQFKNGTTATMTMHGHSYLDGRWIRISGSKGSLLGQFTYGGEKLVYYDHLKVKEKILWEHDITFGAHSDGDDGLMESFVNSLLYPDQEKQALTSARASLESHLMGFAAEKARLEKTIVKMSEIRSL
ncbi:MAG: gfo/Idh/MocA family oxidoreductase [Candidatus Lokiarchaeota archaeon]|nr:gfo/Idh/MocA family oxidoreductase [Candidatus Lokiarchaeota archaeon]MBD3343415.1 gfo/Idh/MocA family oxidoreductase [Candidatus Lokiarchaeota archaeon]